MCSTPCKVVWVNSTKALVTNYGFDYPVFLAACYYFPTYAILQAMELASEVRGQFAQGLAPSAAPGSASA